MRELKQTKLKLPAKASLWYLIASAISKAVGFIITPFFTRMISGQAYGELTLYLTLVGIASVCCSAVNTGSSFYKGLKDYESEKGGFLKSALLVSIFSCLVICIVLFAFSPFLSIPAHLFIPLSIQIICDGIVAVSLSSAKYSYIYKEVTIINLLSSVLPAIITLTLFKVTAGRVRIRIYALLVISVILSVWSLLRIFRNGGKANKRMALSIIKISAPLIPHSISTSLSAQADKIIITHFMGAYALGKYAVVHSLGVGMQFMVSAVGSALGPWMIRRLDAKELKRISALSGLLLTVFSALSLCLISLAPEAMKILAPREYLDAFPALLPIALTTPLLLLSSIITICLVHSSNGGATLTLSLVNASLSLILNFTLIPKLGYLGAGLSIFISNLASVLSGIYLLIRAKIGEVFRTRKILKIFLPTALVGVLAIALFEQLALRVLLLTVPAVMLLNTLYNAKGLIVE
jgi:O-antigen/teichoic acid export membrane protein